MEQASTLISDEEAYRRYLDGEEQGAAILVERYGDLLMLYINGYLKDVHESEDLMMEAFARIFAKERPIACEGSFKAYLYKTARHLTIRFHRKRKLSFLHFEELPFEPQSGMLTDAVFFQKERSGQLYHGLEQLKAEYREALYLVYFEDMRYKEAAQVMGKSEQQMTNLVYRGKQSLKTILEREGFVYEDE